MIHWSFLIPAFIAGVTLTYFALCFLCFMIRDASALLRLDI
jgi:hypothetical protein